MGGCCGTTPEHIKTICSEIRSLQPVQRRAAAVPMLEEGKTAGKASPEDPCCEKSHLGAKLAAGKFVAFVEILPPRGIDASKEIAGARVLQGTWHRLHQRSGRPARERPDERASHVPIDSAARRNRSGTPFLLPRPQYSEHAIGAARRAHDRRTEPDLHHRRSAAHGFLSRCDRGLRCRFHRPHQHR